MLLINAVNAAGRPVELFVKDGKIAAVGQDLSALAGEGETVLDAGGLTVLPAFVDLHCHWRTPGFEYKEDIATGSMAAAAGGYTFVNLMPNTKPICSSAAQAAMVEQKAAEVGLCDVNQTVSITENFDGKTIDHLKTLPASVKFITEDGHGVQDNATMARAFAICTQKDITVMSHAEDMEISPWDYRLAEERYRATGIYARDRDYWLARLDDLPAAPRLPLATSPAAIDRPVFSRRMTTLDKETWQRIKQRGDARGK